MGKRGVGEELGKNSSLICGYLYSNSLPWKEGNFPYIIQDILPYWSDIICTIYADWIKIRSWE